MLYHANEFYDACPPRSVPPFSFLFASRSIPSLLYNIYIHYDQKANFLETCSVYSAPSLFHCSDPKLYSAAQDAKISEPQWIGLLKSKTKRVAPLANLSV